MEGKNVSICFGEKHFSNIVNSSYVSFMFPLCDEMQTNVL